MKTFSSIFPQRLTKIDDLIRQHYLHVTDADYCYFLGEYTVGGGYEFSETNQLIFNFKKPMDRRGRPEWSYKEQAIQAVAKTFRNALNPGVIEKLTFVPIPPSKAKDHPLYDCRLLRMLKAIRPEPPLDIRELIIQTESTAATHNQADRPSPEQIEKIYRINENLAEPEPRNFALVDDVLTTGAHFKAAKSVLSNRFPDKVVIGFFIARSVLSAT